MFRKIFICTLMLAALICAGCGEEKIAGTPDKAILAYAELLTTGDTPNLEAAGFSEDDKTNLRDKMAKSFMNSLDEIAPLSEQSAAELANKFHENFKSKMKFHATLKKNDGDRPIVEFTTTPINIAGATKTLVDNDELIALVGMVGQLKSDGATDEQLKNNADVQKLAVSAFGKYIDAIPVGEEKTFDIPCDKITNAAGKIHWAPADMETFMKFIMGD